MSLLCSKAAKTEIPLRAGDLGKMVELTNSPRQKGREGYKTILEGPFHTFLRTKTQPHIREVSALYTQQSLYFQTAQSLCFDMDTKARQHTQPDPVWSFMQSSCIILQNTQYKTKKNRVFINHIQQTRHILPPSSDLECPHGNHRDKMDQSDSSI